MYVYVCVCVYACTGVGRGRVSCSPGWFWALSIVVDDLEFMLFFFHLWSLRLQPCASRPGLRSAGHRAPPGLEECSPTLRQLSCLPAPLLELLTGLYLQAQQLSFRKWSVGQSASLKLCWRVSLCSWVRSALSLAWSSLCSPGHIHVPLNSWFSFLSFSNTRIHPSTFTDSFLCSNPKGFLSTVSRFIELIV